MGPDKFDHPRSFIDTNQLEKIKEKIKIKPFSLMFVRLKNQYQKLKESYTSGEEYSPYTQARLAFFEACIFLLNGKQEFAQKAYKSLEPIFEDEDFFKDPFSKGLTRAYQLRNLALIYDFCYSGWDSSKIKKVNQKLFALMYSVHASMGYASNNNMASNWMGVRYGSVLMASLLWDDFEKKPEEKSKVKPLEWEADKRLQTYLDETLTEKGWNIESMGYHLYAWSFIGPAFAVQQKNSQRDITAQLSYKIKHSYIPVLMTVVGIDNGENPAGMMVDLSDDNPNVGNYGLMGLGCRIFPESQTGALLWMYKYLTEQKTDTQNLKKGKQKDNNPEQKVNYKFEENPIYNILCMPEDKNPENPESIFGLNYVDPEQGAAIFRSQFKDENDIVMVYNASGVRKGTHWAPDVNTVRLIGLEVPWIVGAGRTQDPDGQSNLFPPPEAAESSFSETGKMINYELREDGSGFVYGRGSALGTVNHERKLWVDYSQNDLAEGIFIIEDSSRNGSRWRINTPEFNSFQINEEGFEIISPHGSSLKAVVLGVKRPLEINTGQVRYGGQTVDHNPGFLYKGKSYEHTKWLEVACAGEIAVVLTLQPRGRKHPSVSVLPWSRIQIGSKKQIKTSLVELT